jgi:hypothetical protein
MYVTLDGKECAKIDVVNAKGSNHVFLDLTSDMGNVITETYDCMGKSVQKKTRYLKKGLYKFAVPVSGLLTIAEK